MQANALVQNAVGAPFFVALLCHSSSLFKLPAGPRSRPFVFASSAMITSSFLFSALRAAASGVSAIQSAPGPVPSCVTDELLALLKGNKRAAFPLFREHLDISASHIVDVSTVTPVASTYLSTQTVTITNVESTTTLDVSTTVVTSFETTIVSTFTYTADEPAATPPVKVKRRNVASLSSALATYAPESISSACSCLNVPRCHKRSESTTTLDASTFTSIATSTDVTSTTTTVTEFSTATSVTTTTESIVTRTTTTALPEPTHFHLVTTLDGEDQYYKGGIFDGQSGWDVIIPSPGTVDAVRFQFDDLGRLIMPGVSQPDIAWPGQGTSFFVNGGEGYHFVFMTTEDNQAQGWVTFQYEVEVANNNNVKVLTYDGSMQLRWLLCAGRLAVAHPDASFNCQDVLVRAEYISLKP
ncbi:hypothetical protein QBC34DRAFT_406285 [Podospora aff. communis PSN243]|uniref:Uncharacterized protein n=1 Tax=Podospora aff. communis PSN243 TaxID=3040156 RepID=A0AAV9GJD0_9PEZI|nr:hypothetical protein QBC34DRAFT_406285 [Podospora aff. communis PSN243]